jgi:hypothetical protein
VAAPSVLWDTSLGVEEWRSTSVQRVGQRPDLHFREQNGPDRSTIETTGMRARAHCQS